MRFWKDSGERISSCEEVASKPIKNFRNAFICWATIERFRHSIRCIRWIVQSCLSLIFQKGKETTVLVFPEITQNLHLRQVEFGIA